MKLFRNKQTKEQDLFAKQIECLKKCIETYQDLLNFQTEQTEYYKKEYNKLIKEKLDK